MLDNSLDSILSHIFGYRLQAGSWLMGKFEVKKEDIGNTVVFCSMCDYKRVVGPGAIPAFCPVKNCTGMLKFIDVTKDLFDDED